MKRIPNTAVSPIMEQFLNALEVSDLKRVREMFSRQLEVATVAQDALDTLVSKRKAAGNLRHAPNPEDFPVYTMTSGGRLWKWNCGWQEFDQSGKSIGQPIGWLEFRKLKPAKKTGDRNRDAWIRLSRPEGPWRRHIDCILNHKLFGNGRVILTDGLHALFEFHTIEGTLRREEVLFNSLTEIATPRPASSKTVNSVNKSKKEVKLSELTLDLL